MVSTKALQLGHSQTLSTCSSGPSATRTGSRSTIGMCSPADRSACGSSSGSPAWLCSPAVRTRSGGCGNPCRHHRRIRAVIAQLEQLVEQRRGPQVRVIPQPLPAVRNERLERIRAAARPVVELGERGGSPVCPALPRQAVPRALFGGSGQGWVTVAHSPARRVATASRGAGAGPDVVRWWRSGRDRAASKVVGSVGRRRCLDGGAVARIGVRCSRRR